MLINLFGEVLSADAKRWRWRISLKNYIIKLNIHFNQGGSLFLESNNNNVLLKQTDFMFNSADDVNKDVFTKLLKIKFCLKNKRMEEQ